MGRIEYFKIDGVAVEPLDTYRQLISVNKLYRYDRSPKHKFFYDVATFIYYVYNTKGEKPTYLGNMAESRRLNVVLKRYLQNYKREDFINNNYVKDIAIEFRMVYLLESERAYETILEDFVNFKAQLLKIPYVIKKNDTFEIEIDGKMVDIPVQFDYPNGDAKRKAIETFNQITNMEKSLQASIKEEKLNSKSKDQVFLFDNTENIPTNFTNDFPFGKE